MGLAKMQFHLMLIDVAYNINLTLTQEETAREEAERLEKKQADSTATSTAPPAPRLTKAQQYARMKDLVEQETLPRSGAPPPGHLLAPVGAAG